MRSAAALLLLLSFALALPASARDPYAASRSHAARIDAAVSNSGSRQAAQGHMRRLEAYTRRRNAEAGARLLQQRRTSERRIRMNELRRSGTPAQVALPRPRPAREPPRRPAPADPGPQRRPAPADPGPQRCPAHAAAAPRQRPRLVGEPRPGDPARLRRQRHHRRPRPAASEGASRARRAGAGGRGPRDRAFVLERRGRDVPLIAPVRLGPLPYEALA